MAKLETIVRPAVFPNIRPPARVKAAELEGEDEAPHVIRGGSGGMTDLPHSWSVNTSRSKHKEVKRRVDQVKVYQEDDDGNVNTANWLLMNILDKLWMKTSGRSGGVNPSPDQPGSGAPGGGSADVTETMNFAPVTIANNMELIRKGVIIES